jgi:type II secretion system protein D
MKYADAEEVSSMLNDLIGNGSSSSSQKNNQNANAGRTGSTARNLTRTTTTQPQRRPGGANPTFSQNSRLGELNKDNIKILADKRINAVVVMARTADMKAVQEVIEDMDVKLSQVLIETVIVQVELGDELTTGVDWIKRGRKDGGTFANGDMMAGGGGSGSSTLKNFEGTGLSLADKISALKAAGIDTTNMKADDITKLANEFSMASADPIGGGLNYFLKSDKLDLSAVIQMAKSDSRTKVLASPILMTVDNKEATIEATDMIYLFSGYQYSGSTYNGSQVRNYEKRDIGLTVKVTPRINPNGTVVLTVEQTFETQGADQNVPNENGGTDPYATVTTRKIQSDVSVENRQTVVMGGLTRKTETESESGIPILKDIPYIGKWLFGSVSQTEKRSELLVFMTPYVLDDGEEGQLEALRRKKALSDSRPWEDNGWSSSPLADPVSKKEQLRRLSDEWKRQDQERKTKLEIEKAKMERAKNLKKMSDAERAYWIELHKKELEEEHKETQEEQDALRKMVEGIKKEKLGDAEKEIEKSKTIEKNEYQKSLEKTAETKEEKKTDSPKAGAAQ